MGDVRDDGYIFHCVRTFRGRRAESWLSPTAYHRQRVRNTFESAKRRAKELGLPFSITMEHLLSIYPKDGNCPALGITMEWGGGISGRDNSPSLDRRVPSAGYVCGNVRFISNRANMLKNNATADEMRRVAEYLHKVDY